MATAIKDAVSKTTAEAVSKEIKEAVTAILAKHGLTTEKIRTGYGDNYSIKIEAGKKEIGKNGVDLNSQDAVYYARFGYSVFVDFKEVEGSNGTQFLGDSVELKAELGQEFMYGKDVFFFAGVNPRKSKFPITAIKKADGKTYGLPDTVVAILNAKTK